MVNWAARCWMAVLLLFQIIHYRTIRRLKLWKTAPCVNVVLVVWYLLILSIVWVGGYFTQATTAFCLIGALLSAGLLIDARWRSKDVRGAVTKLLENWRRRRINRLRRALMAGERTVPRYGGQGRMRVVNRRAYIEALFYCIRRADAANRKRGWHWTRPEIVQHLQYPMSGLQRWLAEHDPDLYRLSAEIALVGYENGEVVHYGQPANVPQRLRDSNRWPRDYHSIPVDTRRESGKE